MSPASPRVQELAEHLDARHHRLGGRLDADDLDFLAHLDDAALDAAGHHRAAARDREHVLDRHQERLVLRPLRLRDIGVHRLHQLQDRLLAQLRLLVFQRHQRRAPDDRDLVAREVVLRQQLADLQLHQIQQLRVVHHVHLVQEHHDRRHAHLAGQQNVLAGLRHRAVGGTDNENRPVHLRRARDHVLHVVRVPGAIDVRVVPLGRLVLDVRRRDRDASGLLLRRLVDLIVRRVGGAPGLGQNLRDRRRQARLPMIDVPDRPHVAVRLLAFKLCFGHRCRSLFSVSRFGNLSASASLRCSGLERVKGIEPSSSAWKAVALPLSYTRKAPHRSAVVEGVGFEPT